jgi:3-phenylpropionate/trans-cinnamate dioxygenase ferredoxin reductase subunit
VAIVGGGHGGGNAAALLRQHAFDGEVILIGDEPELPYDRPPLSKDYLAGKIDREQVNLFPATFYQEQDITLRTGQRVAAVNPAQKDIVLDGGDRIAYDDLILATGAAARTLRIPGGQLRGVHTLRTVADSVELRTAIRPGARVAIVGGGYIGLEVAASAILRQAQVTVLEREGRVLARVGSPALSEFLSHYHDARGVTVLTSVDVVSFEDDGTGSIGAVRLSNGDAVPCEAVVVGVGAVPRDELALAAGLRCDNGVLVDDCARTSEPAIYAIGDMTRRPLHYRTGSFRLESIPSTVEQARRAIATILGKPAPRPEIPWFWSDQFDLKLQIVGLLDDADRTVVRGDTSGEKFAVFHLLDNKIRAVEAVNRPADFMLARRLIDRATDVDPDRLGDESFSLRQLVA